MNILITHKDGRMQPRYAVKGFGGPALCLRYEGNADGSGTLHLLPLSEDVPRYFKEGMTLRDFLAHQTAGNRWVVESNLGYSGHDDSTGAFRLIYDRAAALGDSLGAFSPGTPVSATHAARTCPGVFDAQNNTLAAARNTAPITVPRQTVASGAGNSFVPTMSRLSSAPISPTSPTSPTRRADRFRLIHVASREEDRRIEPPVVREDDVNIDSKHFLDAAGESLGIAGLSALVDWFKSKVSALSGVDNTHDSSPRP